MRHRIARLPCLTRVPAVPAQLISLITGRRSPLPGNLCLHSKGKSVFQQNCYYCYYYYFFKKTSMFSVTAQDYEFRNIFSLKRESCIRDGRLLHLNTSVSYKTEILHYHNLTRTYLSSRNYTQFTAAPMVSYLFMKALWVTLSTCATNKIL